MKNWRQFVKKNTKCEGVEVNQLFIFFTSYSSLITQNNWDMTWNYSMVACWVWVHVKMCQAFQTLRCNNVATVFSILFAFSAVKGPAKELRLSFTVCQVRNMSTKYFFYFQGLRVLKCHRTERSNRVNYQLKWPLQQTSLSSTPPPAWISRVFDPPPTKICRIPSVGGVWTFSGTAHLGLINVPLTWLISLQHSDYCACIINYYSCSVLASVNRPCLQYLTDLIFLGWFILFRLSGLCFQHASLLFFPSRGKLYTHLKNGETLFCGMQCMMTSLILYFKAFQST